MPYGGVSWFSARICGLSFCPGTAMRSLRLALVLLLALFCGACATSPRRGDGEAPLILVSVDGFRADYLQRGLTPTLAALAREGVRADAMRPSFPSLTFPNHYTLVTGLYPEHHGIINNRITDPASGRRFVYKEAQTTADPAWWGGEPIWVGAERQGLRTATMFWPGSDVAIAGQRPSHWRPYDGAVTPLQRVDQVLAWLDLPAPERPRFLTLYFDHVDHAGHDHGPDSPEVDAALAEFDAALARLRDGLRARGLDGATNLLVVSDHGMAATRSDYRVVIDDVVDGTQAEVITPGVLAGLRARPGHEAEVERRLLGRHEHMECWRREQMPARLHYGSHPFTPPLLCLADEGAVITTRAYAERPGARYSRGEHGYDNALPSMRALFVAQGPAFRSGQTVGEFINVDVYPLMACVLGIRAAPNDGTLATLRPILRKPDCPTR